jgi:hypothetical protein
MPICQWVTATCPKCGWTGKICLTDCIFMAEDSDGKISNSDLHCPVCKTTTRYGLQYSGDQDPVDPKQHRESKSPPEQAVAWNVFFSQYVIYALWALGVGGIVVIGQVLAGGVLAVGGLWLILRYRKRTQTKQPAGKSSP